MTFLLQNALDLLFPITTLPQYEPCF